MSDYIERQAVIDAVRETFKRIPTTAIRAMDTIKALPPADVVQMRHGRWTHKPNIYGVAYCSECDYELRINNASYCPNCGAKMDGERKE